MVTSSEVLQLNLGWMTELRLHCFDQWSLVTLQYHLCNVRNLSLVIPLVLNRPHRLHFMSAQPFSETKAYSSSLVWTSYKDTEHFIPTRNQTSNYWKCSHFLASRRVKGQYIQQKKKIQYLLFNQKSPSSYSPHKIEIKNPLHNIQPYYWKFFVTGSRRKAEILSFKNVSQLLSVIFFDKSD